MKEQAAPQTSRNYAVMVESYKRVAGYSREQRRQMEQQMFHQFYSPSESGAAVPCHC